MKILVVSQYFWPENFRINDLAAGLVELGHEVVVLTGVPNYPRGSIFPGYGILGKHHELYKGVTVLRVPLVPRGSGSGSRLAVNYLSFALCSTALCGILCRGGIDCIFVFQTSPVTVGLPALLLKRLKKAPVMLWVLDLWPESVQATGAVRSPRVMAGIDWLSRIIYRGCDRILVASRGFKESMEAKGVPPELIEYLPNWLEPEYGRSGDGHAPVQLPQGFRVMFAGNIGVAQDFETILAAAEKLLPYREIQWVIVGEGRQLDWVRREIERRQLESVHLLGHHPAEAMQGFFAEADAMLVTLKRDPAFALTVPGKIQSYMACGRPIVAALDGEGRKLIAETAAGVCAPAEDAGALAAAVLTLYQTPRQEREAMGRRGREYCRANFSREILFHRLEGWLRELACRCSR